MKHFLPLLLAFVTFSFTAKAQYVTIDDIDFRLFLQAKYPACFNQSNQLDTTCTAIIEEDSLTIAYTNGIKKVDELNYFKKLTYLNFNFLLSLNTITNLPPTLKYLGILTCDKLLAFPQLPDSLKTFQCDYTRLFSSLSSLPMLDTLITRYNQLSRLIALPPTLKYLDCSGNIFLQAPVLPAGLKVFVGKFHSFDSDGSFPVLPNGLVTLSCDTNYIRSLPNPLPDSLVNLTAASTFITSFPPLPVGLQIFRCRGTTYLTALPALPPTLTELDCSLSNLRSLPPLPSTLLKLDLSSNNLKNLPTDIPNTLKYLNCNFDSLSFIASLPDSLLEFWCAYNQLPALPVLPNSIKDLRCMANRLNTLPRLPDSLEYLDCNSNQISNLPFIPPLVREANLRANNFHCLPWLAQVPNGKSQLLEFESGKINCIPNYAQNVFYVDATTYQSLPINNFPICTPINNINGCHAFPLITGYVFYDANSNGVKDASEPYKSNVKVTLPGVGYGFTDNNGYYEITADSIGTYTIQLQTATYYNIVPASATFNFNRFDTTVAKDFALQPNTSKDSLSVKITPVNRTARPGFSYPYFVEYENSGTTVLSSTVTFNYDNIRLTYDSSSNAAVIDNGSSLKLAENNFLPGFKKSFIAYFKVKTTTPLSSIINAVTTISSGNSTSVDSTSTVVLGSFDPNDKQATPQLSPSQVVNGAYVDYTVRFQNTGTDTAFNVIISDTLSNDLQAGTLEMISSSYTCKATVKDGIVFFEFLNIRLPDSIVNEPGSHGFVSFRVRPIITIAVNTIIPNKAAIYFDYNTPVITNIAGTLIKNPVVLPLKLNSFSAVQKNDHTVSLYWSTANEINTRYFVIERGNDGVHFNKVSTVNAKGQASNNYTATVANENTNIVFYRLKMVDNNGSFVYSPIVKIVTRKDGPGIFVLTNPAKDFIAINTNNRDLYNTPASLVNTQGAVIKNFIIRAGNQVVGIKDLPAGVYYLKCISASQKILVQ